MRGLLFGGMTLFLQLSAAASGSIFDENFHLRSRPHWDALFVPGAVAVLQIWVAIAVVQQTWRRTRLRAEYDVLKLDLLSPLQRHRYVWAGDQILDIVCVITANEESYNPLAEMLITRAVGGDVRLFTDHPAPVVRDIVAAVGSVFLRAETGSGGRR